MSSLKSYPEFWSYYLQQHQKPSCRWLHVAGLLSGVFLAILGVATQQAQLILWGVVIGYALSWIGHFFIEKNKPATFKYPLWSFIASFQMCWQTIRGKI
ncbi:MAG: Mpo1-like protein [Pseudobdellovibrionaceae bacterium]